MQGAAPCHGGPRDGIKVCSAGRGGRACELGELIFFQRQVGRLCKHTISLCICCSNISLWKPVEVLLFISMGTRSRYSRGNIQFSAGHCTHFQVEVESLGVTEVLSTLLVTLLLKMCPKLIQFAICHKTQRKAFFTPNIRKVLSFLNCRSNRNDVFILNSIHVGPNKSYYKIQLCGDKKRDNITIAQYKI